MMTDKMIMTCVIIFMPILMNLVITDDDNNVFNIMAGCQSRKCLLSVFKRFCHFPIYKKLAGLLMIGNFPTKLSAAGAERGV